MALKIFCTKILHCVAQTLLVFSIHIVNENLSFKILFPLRKHVALFPEDGMGGLNEGLFKLAHVAQHE